MPVFACMCVCVLCVMHACIHAYVCVCVCVCVCLSVSVCVYHFLINKGMPGLIHHVSLLSQEAAPRSSPADTVQHVGGIAVFGGGGAGGPQADDQLWPVSGSGRLAALLHSRLLPVDAD